MYLPLFLLLQSLSLLRPNRSGAPSIAHLRWVGCTNSAPRFRFYLIPHTSYLIHKSPLSTPQSANPKLFFTLLLSKIACQAPKPAKNPQHTLSKQHKTFPKVVFSYDQSGTIKLEIEKAPATAGAFSVPDTVRASKSFIGNILAVSPMVAIF